MIVKNVRKLIQRYYDGDLPQDEADDLKCLLKQQCGGTARGIDETLASNMPPTLAREFDNVKKAFADADQAVSDGRIDDRTLEELFKAIDGAQTVRQNLLPEHLRSKGGNRDLFVEFIHLELPMARARSSTDANDLPFELQEFELFNMDKQRVEMFTMGEVAYAARCMIMHENENLNVAEEGVDYHVMLDWNISATDMMLGYQRDQKFICSGPFLVQRLRQIVASFIQGVELCKFDPATSTSFSISMDPQMGSIQPRPKKRLDGG